MVVVPILKPFIVLSVYVKNNTFLVSTHELNLFSNVLYMVHIASCKLYILVYVIMHRICLEPLKIVFMVSSVARGPGSFLTNGTLRVFLGGMQNLA